jgi:hypothetical protein
LFLYLSMNKNVEQLSHKDDVIGLEVIYKNIVCAFLMVPSHQLYAKKIALLTCIILSFW